MKTNKESRMLLFYIWTGINEPPYKATLFSNIAVKQGILPKIF